MFDETNNSYVVNIHIENVDVFLDKVSMTQKIGGFLDCNVILLQLLHVFRDITAHNYRIDSPNPACVFKTLRSDKLEVKCDQLLVPLLAPMDDCMFTDNVKAANGGVN